MSRSSVPVIGGASLMLAALAGCSLYEPDVDVKPALAINGQSVVGDAQKQYDLGKLYLSQGRFAAAAQAFQMAAIAKHPPSIEVLNALAVAYDNLGRYDLADEYYRQALNLDARNGQTLNNFGISLARRGMPERAALVLAEAARNEPKNETVTANLAELRAETTRPAESPASTATTMVIPPDKPTVLPRVERVGLDTLQLVTEMTEPRAAVPGIVQAQTPISAVRAAEPGVEEKVAAVPRPRVVQIEIAAAPEAVKPVTVVATVAPPVTVDSPMAVDQVALSDEENRLGKVQARVEVSNGAGRTRMATRMRGYLAGRGVTVARVTNDSSFSNKTTVIFYRPGFEQAAQELSKSLPVPVATAPATRLATDVRVRLGRDLMTFDLSLQEKKKA